MKYQTATAFRAAIDARLKHYAGEHGQAALARVRKQIVFDRFLARLFTAAPGQWTLKGGLALDYRLGDMARATRDIDLLHVPDLKAMDAKLANTEPTDPTDFFAFSIRRTNQLDGLIDGSAIRYHIQADLDGRKFEEFIVDVGFDIPAGLATESVQRNGFLDFAGIESPLVQVISIEVHLAEKIHAYTKPYSGNRQNTRVKDLIDIVLIGSTQQLNAGRMQPALAHTFESRESHPLRQQLGPPPATWFVPYRDLAGTVSLDPDIAAGYAFAATLVDPLLDGEPGPDAMWAVATHRWA